MNYFKKLQNEFALLISGASLTPGVSAAVVLAMVLSLAGLLTSAALTEVSGNPASRLGTMETLVDYQEWTLNRSTYRYVTVDKVRLGNEFFSSKPPVYTVMGAGVYGAIRGLSGWRIAEPPDRLVFLLRVLLHIVPFFVGMIVAARFLRRRIAHDAVWLWGFVAFATGTFIYGYSATFNNHAPAALLVLASFAAAVEISEGERSNLLWFGAGFCASLAVTFDFGVGVFAVTLVAFLTLKAPSKGLIWLLVGALGPVLVHLHLTSRLTGSLLPFYGQDQLYSYPGSYWDHARDFDALAEPMWTYAGHALFGHHGLFAMTPLFLLAIPGLGLMIKRPSERAIGLFSAVVVCLTIAIYVGFGPKNYGGTASGMRWFIILVPLLWYAALRFADSRWESRAVRWLLGILIVVGVFHAVAALTGPWNVSPWNWLLRYMGLGSVPEYDWFQ